MKFEEAIAKLRDEGRPEDALVDCNGEKLFYIDANAGICSEYDLCTCPILGKNSLLDKIVNEEIYYVPAELKYMSLQTAIRECTINDAIRNADCSRVWLKMALCFSGQRLQYRLH